MTDALVLDDLADDCEITLTQALVAARDWETTRGAERSGRRVRGGLVEDHKTEAVYRRHAIVSEGDLGEGLDKLHAHSAEGQEQGQLGGKGGFVGFGAHPNVSKYKRLSKMPGWRNWQTHRT
jgi:hypothetical protein